MKRPAGDSRRRPHERTRLGRALGAALGLCLLLALASRTLAWREGPPPDRVGACGFGLTCRDAGCHSTFPIGSATLAWDLSQEAPVPGPLPTAWVPGATYDLRLDVSDSDPGAVVWGFEFAPLMGCPVPRAAGTIVPLDPLRVRSVLGAFDVVFLSHDCRCPGETPDCCGYVPEGAPDANGWSFRWTAPDRGAGTVRFDLAINAANHDGTPVDDRIVLGSVALPEEACPPRIEDLLVRKSACNLAQPGVAQLDVTWTSTGGATADVLRVLEDAALLRTTPPQGWPLAAGGCVPFGPSPLVFLSAAGPCELGSEGLH